ncbi:LytR/AlgR family response regulator transcription factor [Terrimonas pollutisoli]|uniref:LytR/AlgR family response regulator transcription factor n=1 Tax=Terrimonas pollutisoli TaxID=3034147 RepID=UPI0023EADDD7|nr:LytTR family DNA-binding domain-containing protein [Terrimonas sp. H1YJ31]
MRVLIIEDETPAANRLAKLLQSNTDELQVVRKIDSVEAAVKYLQTADEIDLIFMDIQLADGLSFDIFKQVKVTAPVIFTTAFDQYTLKAFKVNSVDYLLKPIDEKELQQAVEKYRQLYQQKENGLSEKILKIMQDINGTRYKERLLIKRGQQLSYLKTDATAYCYADGKLCYAVDFTNNKYMLESNLSQLEEQLQPTKFYRINRHLLVNIDAVNKVYTWLGGRLKLELSPSTTSDTVVSRERVNGFKDWLGQ